MDTKNVLDDLAQNTRDLVAQRLRSKAVVINRLGELILRANDLGHTHETIHQVLKDAGLDLSFGVYRNSLHRYRKSNVDRMIQPDKVGGVKAVGSYDPTARAAETTQVMQAGEVVPSGSVHAARDALQEAKEVVGNVDYSKRARDNLRKSKK